MRILMRNTVFKTAVLAGLFLCMLMFAGAFSGITASVHATTAGEVGTDQAKLQEFVEAAIDEYYVNTIIKACDFTDAPFAAAIARAEVDLATATVEQIKPLIALFPLAGITGRSDIEPYCDFTQRFGQIFGYEEGDWRSGSIYLFIMDDQGNMLYNGDDRSSEGMRVVAVDEGGRDVRDLIVGEAETPSREGFVKHCWEDPDVEGDEIVDSNGDPIPEKAPGDSAKISYVVDPFQYLEAPALSPSLGIIFGSGIYPGMDNELPECDGDGMAGDMDDMDDMDDMESGPVTSVSGGGCAIAAGSDGMPRGTAFSLLLMVAALLFSATFGNRAIGRRNGNGS